MAPFSFKNFLGSHYRLQNRLNNTTQTTSSVEQLVSQYENKYNALYEEYIKLIQQRERIEKECATIKTEVDSQKDESNQKEAYLAEVQAAANNLRMELAAKENVVKELTFRVEKRREELFEKEKQSENAKKDFVQQCERIYVKVRDISKMISSQKRNGYS